MEYEDDIYIEAILSVFDLLSSILIQDKARGQKEHGQDFTTHVEMDRLETDLR